MDGPTAEMPQRGRSSRQARESHMQTNPDDHRTAASPAASPTDAADPSYPSSPSPAPYPTREASSYPATGAPTAPPAPVWHPSRTPTAGTAATAGGIQPPAAPAIGGTYPSSAPIVTSNPAPPAGRPIGPGTRPSAPIGPAPRPNALEKLAAGVAGAAQGVERGLADSGLEHHAGAALGEADRFTRTAAHKANAMRAQADPAAPVSVGWASGPTPVVGQAQARIDRVGRRVRHAAHEARVRAEAVQESSRRARRAPAVVAQDVKLAAKAYGRGVAKGIAGYAVAGALGAAAFVVLTVFLVQGLNLWLGAPWGALVVALLYGAIAGVFVARARTAQAKARADAQRLMAHARTEAQGVLRPVRQAFRRPGVTPEATGIAYGPAVGRMDARDAREARGTADGTAHRFREAP